MRMTPTNLGGLVLCFAMLTASLGSDGAAPDARSGEWLPLPQQSLEVAAGSALDLSMLVPGEAGNSGALQLDGKGRLQLDGSNDPRFNCGMVANGPDLTWDLPDHAAADALAVQFKRHGYNLVRIHFMDGRLIRGAKADFAFDPEKLDRFYYLLAAFKRNGVFWMLDMLTSPDGGRRQNFSSPHSVDNVKNRLNFDPAAESEWLRMVDAIYARPNPYTGRSALSDPALAFVVGANENSIAFWSQISANGPYPTGLAEKFGQWIRAQYPSTIALRTALPDLNPSEANGKTPVAPPQNWNASGPRMTLFMRFLSSLEVQSYRWMEQKLRDRGYAGPVLGFHEVYKQLDNRTRSALPIIDEHAYVGEVTSYAPGAPLRIPSSIDTEGLAPILTNMAFHWLDRPMVSSEYGTPFPNPYRRESGLIFPAIASFQGYSAICRMANLSVEPQISVTGPGITPYRVGVDPVARVAETLATFLFYRRDVSEGDKGVVAIPFGETEKNRIGSAFFPLEMRKAALVARFGLIDPGKLDTLANPKTIIPPPAMPYNISAKALSQVVDMLSGNTAEREVRLFAALWSNGTLPPGNLTDPAKGLYQSQTGQMTLDQTAGTFKITTARTVAVTTKSAGRDINLGALSVLSVDQGALIAASALDNKPLTQSSKILLMLTGDATNSHMALGGGSGASNRTVMAAGNAPILLQRVRATIRLQSVAKSAATLSILSLNGEVTQKQPVKRATDGSLSLDLDTAGAKNMPTTYFLLEKSAQP